MGNISFNYIQCIFPIPISTLYGNLLFSPFEYQFSTSLAFFPQCALQIFFPLAFLPFYGLTCASSIKV